MTPSWELHCDGEGDVTIAVLANGMAYEEYLVENSDSIVIHQLKPHLIVDITSPSDGTQYTAGSAFNVVAQVQNTGNADAYGVTCTAAFTGNASNQSTATQSTSPQDIAVGGSGIVTWNFECNGAGSVVITVDAAGYTNSSMTVPIPDANIEADTVTISQVLSTTHVVTPPYSYSPQTPPPEYNWPRPPELVATFVNAQPRQTVANQPVTIFANMANRGDLATSYIATLKINGQIEQVKKGSLEGNRATPVKFVIYKSEPGIYNVELNGQRTYFTIIDTEVNNSGSSPVNSGIIVFTVLGVLVLASLVILIRRFI